MFYLLASSLSNIDAVDSNGLAVRYELIGGNLSDIVSIDATTGEVTISQEIDRSVAYLYTANLCVFSGTYFCSNARNAQKRQIEITFSPISVVSLVSFTPPVIFISDDVVANTLVLDVDATDSLGFSLGNEITGSDIFGIDATTGEITTTRLLDLNDGALYSLILCVYSNAGSCANATNAVTQALSIEVQQVPGVSGVSVSGPTFFVVNRGQANKLYRSFIKDDGFLMFATPIEFDSRTDSSVALEVADINNDGYLDVVVANVTQGNAISDAIYFASILERSHKNSSC